jgi:hypothetical protein
MISYERSCFRLLLAVRLGQPRTRPALPDVRLATPSRYPIEKEKRR